ncbi:Sugar phosphate permease [Sphingomonas sp. YR710]|uniref:MFS transporter n=1 Tax=Sphingomonas sp. YR710 TaxID=1882773 RepID=UPI00088402D9|nr:MFS transporter [Sphingomonas sp. YR710]SDD50171.1 Sugar phosphate permease [Sphingomonas sp. YR710]
MSYSNEFRSYWRQLLGASIGVSSGITLNFFTLSVFGPRLIADLHWTKAQFALIGSISIFSVFVLPIAGTLVDRFGTRRTASVGFMAVPLGFIALSMMSGSIYQFLAINLVMSWLGLLTSGLVFCRVVVDRFDKARGIALSLMMSASPLAGAIVPQVIAPFIAAHGWRSAYLLLALISVIGGVMAIMLVGPTLHAPAEPARTDGTKSDGTLTRLKAIACNPVFILLMAGMFLVNMPRTFTTSQLKIVVLDYGFTDAIGTSVVSVYAIGTIFGRCVSGLALDRLPTHLVALIILSIAATGYLYFLFPLPNTALLMSAVFVMGLAFGCEFDIGAYLISRNFPVRDFSKLYATMDIMLGAGAAVGSLILSALLKETSGYHSFMVVATIGTLVGAVLLGLTGRIRKRSDAPVAG